MRFRAMALVVLIRGLLAAPFAADAKAPAKAPSAGLLRGGKGGTHLGGAGLQEGVRTAKALGLTLPAVIVLRATEVIQ